jgi:purine-binding chemotaxis protein CheW
MAFYCAFDVGGRRVGIDMRHVRETIETMESTPVLFTPPFVLGLINLRGQVLPAYDLTTFLGGTPRTGAWERAVVVERDGLRFATPASRIATVEAEESSFTPHPEIALYPSLEARVPLPEAEFDLLNLDRLEACLSQAMQFHELMTT